MIRKSNLELEPGTEVPGYATLSLRDGSECSLKRSGCTRHLRAVPEGQGTVAWDFSPGHRPAERLLRGRHLPSMIFRAFAVLIIATAPVAFADAADGELEDRLWQHRNLGKAFYENPATQYQAVGEFEKALELAPDSAREQVNYALALLRAGKTEEGVAQLEKAQKTDPSVPHTWFNLGIEYKRASRYDDAIAQLEKMIELVPDEPISHYNLGVLYKLGGATEKALLAFERSAEIDPNLAGPRFQLATTLRQLKRADEAKQQMLTFRELKKKQAGAAVPEDLEWSWYSEIYDTLESMAPPASPLTPRFESRTGPEVGADAALAAVVLEGGRLGVAWASSKGAGFWSPQGTGKLDGIEAARGLAVGDVDNDGLSDLVVLGRSQTSLWRGTGAGFERVAELPGDAGSSTFGAAIFVDVDHDYDLDLLLFGESSRLLRNDGESWSDQSGDFPFQDGKARAVVAFDVMADSQGTDVLVAYAGTGGVLYRDRLLGRYEAVTLRSVGPKTRQLLATDIDHDGWTDILVAGDRVKVLRNSTRQTFEPLPAINGASAPVALADFDHRGSQDLLAAGGLFRHRGDGRFAPPSTGEPVQATAGAVLAADFDGDTRVDRVTISDEGRLVVESNRLEAKRGAVRISLRGVKNLAQAPGAEIEVKAGRLYQKQLYDGRPLVFGLGDRTTIDAIRISWPNGLIQNETSVTLDAERNLIFEEAQRLSGSCPMIFTWDGEHFRFITDVLGVAPLGASAGDGEYFPVDSDETIQIETGALVPRDGAYEIRITEELREIAYLDRIRLHAVDRPADLSVYVNDKFIGPPFPESRLWGVEERHYPTSATDHRGRNVLPALLEKDQVYPDDFERSVAGVAEMHQLELDFGAVAADGEAILVLSGWVDWADGSTFRGVATSTELGLVMPRLEMQDAAGEWQTVIEDMGIPAGKPKSIVVNLSGLWPSAERRVRITTNLAVYWDEIFLGEESSEPPVTVREARRTLADFRFRGFSRPVVHAQRLQPEVFVYADRRDFTMWNPTPGLYTRYGDVMPLLDDADDRFVIMGSGDELRLLFEALPDPPPAGWVREFLLTVDGWAKDGDANTAFSQSVEPLPYRAMPQYPYEAPYRFPEGEAFEKWRETYNTRPGLRLIRPLAEAFGPDRKRSDATSGAP